MELTAAETPASGTRIRNFPGTYDYYLYRIAVETGTLTESPGVASSGTAAASFAVGKGRSPVGGKESDVSAGSDQKLGAASYEEQKKQRAEKRKREKEEEKLLTQLTETENRIKALEAELASPEVYADGEKIRSIQQQIQVLKDAAVVLTEQWEAIAQDGC